MIKFDLLLDVVVRNKIICVSKIVSLPYEPNCGDCLCVSGKELEVSEVEDVYNVDTQSKTIYMSTITPNTKDVISEMVILSQAGWTLCSVDSKEDSTK